MVAREAAVGGGGAAGVAGVLGLLVLTELGVPMPIPADILMLLVGERAAAGVLPLWVAALAFVAVAAVGTSTAFVLARGPGRGVLAHLGPRVGLSTERVEGAGAALQRRGRHALAVGRSTPGLRTLTLLATASSPLPARLVLAVRRRRAGAAGAQVWSEALCPACLAVTAARRAAGRELVDTRP